VLPFNLQAKLFAVRAACIASLGGLLFGFDVGVIAGALPQLAAEMQLTVSQQDLVVSLMLVGALFGSATGGLLCDRVGRWWTIMLTSAVFVLGGSMLYSAQTNAHLYAGRIVVSRMKYSTIYTGSVPD
jgi:MFS transporter, SP family, solute carrier family 2 (facilitated glucose transporter), member 12